MYTEDKYFKRSSPEELYTIVLKNGLNFSNIYLLYNWNFSSVIRQCSARFSAQASASPWVQGILHVL